MPATSSAWRISASAKVGDSVGSSKSDPAPLLEALGGERTLTPFGEQVVADARGMTAVPGVFVAGNTAEPMAMVSVAAGSGVMAGAAVNGDLAAADLARAVESRARPFLAAMEAKVTEAVLGNRRHGI